MKSPKTKKVVRAWAVITGKGNLVWDHKFMNMSYYPRIANINGLSLPDPFAHIVRCEISFSLPTKKSAGKVGKRV